MKRQTNSKTVKTSATWSGCMGKAFENQSYRQNILQTLQLALFDPLQGFKCWTKPGI